MAPLSHRNRMQRRAIRMWKRCGNLGAAVSGHSSERGQLGRTFVTHGRNNPAPGRHGHTGEAPLVCQRQGRPQLCRSQTFASVKIVRRTALTHVPAFERLLVPVSCQRRRFKATHRSASDRRFPASLGLQHHHCGCPAHGITIGGLAIQNTAEEAG
jgi:hypothetical protein